MAGRLVGKHPRNVSTSAVALRLPSLLSEERDRWCGCGVLHTFHELSLPANRGRTVNEATDPVAQRPQQLSVQRRDGCTFTIGRKNPALARGKVDSFAFTPPPFDTLSVAVADSGVGIVSCHRRRRTFTQGLGHLNEVQGRLRGLNVSHTAALRRHMEGTAEPSLGVNSMGVKLGHPPSPVPQPAMSLGNTSPLFHPRVRANAQGVSSFPYQSDNLQALLIMAPLLSLSLCTHCALGC